jgi:hypothetical protein
MKVIIQGLPEHVVIRALLNAREDEVGFPCHDKECLHCLPLRLIRKDWQNVSVNGEPLDD